MASSLDNDEHGFKPQSVNVYNQHLPYGLTLHKEALEYLKKIKLNLSSSLLLSEHSSLAWTRELRSYLTLYGFYFPKEDHLVFIKTLLHCILIPDLESSAIVGITSDLIILIRYFLFT